MSIIIPGDLKANYPPGEYPGVWGTGSFGPGCYCPFFYDTCTCYMMG